MVRAYTSNAAGRRKGSKSPPCSRHGCNACSLPRCFIQAAGTLSLVHGAQRETAAIHLRQAVQGTEGVTSYQFVEHNRFQMRPTLGNYFEVGVGYGIFF